MYVSDDDAEHVIAVRLCVPVANDPRLNEEVSVLLGRPYEPIVRQCGLCDSDVWYDETMPLPEELSDRNYEERIICNNCALEDPDMAPVVMYIMRLAQNPASLN